SNQTNLTKNPAYDADPAWSPDGKKILFVTDRDGDGFRVYSMDADGKNEKDLSKAGNRMGFVYPAWSPEGTKIAYAGTVLNGTSPGTEIFVMDAAGDNIKQLTKLGGQNSYAAWSPDGKKIIFQHHDSYDKPGPVYIMDPDGSNQKVILESE